ncbi:hypothetical protein JTE90_016992 [Oedothorax gibbosus]|uniref:Uncharacterized protein n=1 Tax=Oedothorax gibbosus TaxID=931172 RepID=A0AAV6UKX6_9ARAC|nr:hypothetical protein JTE90_016992 [Oedothorax gibbosus]
MSSQVYLKDIAGRPVANKSAFAKSNSPSCAAPCTRLSILESGFSKAAHTLTHTTRSARSFSTSMRSKQCRSTQPYLLSIISSVNSLQVVDLVQEFDRIALQLGGAQ